MESQLVAKAQVNIHFSFIGFCCGCWWVSDVPWGGWSSGIHLGLHHQVLSEAGCLTALLEIACGFVVKKSSENALQGSGWVSSTFFLLHVDD